MIPRILVVILLAFTGGLAQAEGITFFGKKEASTQVRYGLCNNSQIEYFFRAYHPGVDSREAVKRGSLNEDTPGVGIRCSLGTNVIAHAATLINSQWGKSDLLALGYELEVIRLWNLSASCAGEVGYLNYGVPRYNKIVSGFIPLFSCTVAWKISEFNSVAIRQYTLPVGNIQLYSLVWQRRF